MQNITFRQALAATTTAALLALSSMAQAAETYMLDPAHTAVTFHINHFGFSNPAGKFMNVTGKLTLDEAKPEDSAVDVTIPVGEVLTGVPKLDEHIKTKDFFDVGQFPTATFKSTK